MNLDNIKAIVNSGKENWKQLLYQELATDESAIVTIVQILGAERSQKQQLITDLNFQLSRAHVALEEPKANKDGFVQKEIRKFYEEGRVNHCYNMGQK